MAQIGPNYGQDGAAHLTYYDRDNGLSFVYDDVHPNTIAVSHGGYAEPVIDTFRLELGGYDRLDQFFNAFRLACKTYVAGWEQRHVMDLEWGEIAPKASEVD